MCLCLQNMPLPVESHIGMPYACLCTCINNALHVRIIIIMNVNIHFDDERETEKCCERQKKYN